MAAVSLLAITGAGAWIGPEPVDGALHWIGKGLLQFGYAAALALSLWLLIGRHRGISLLLWLGVACVAVAAWDITSRLRADQVRREANELITAFHDQHITLPGLSDAVEQNPYIGAYMIMRDAHWELQSRLDAHLAGYRAAYLGYVADGQFTATKRLRSRQELWRAYRQVGYLRERLTAIEEAPFDTADLMSSVNLLAVDQQTREAYAQDLEQAIAGARARLAEFIAGEQRVLARIDISLDTVIAARGRYRFADGRILFDDPADARRFAGTVD